MIIRKASPPQGICFAWLPVWTDKGKVWLEFVHYKFNETEFGSYSYWRMLPDETYNSFPYPRAQASFENRNCGQCGGGDCNLCGYRKKLFAEPVRPGD